MIQDRINRIKEFTDRLELSDDIEYILRCIEKEIEYLRLDIASEEPANSTELRIEANAKKCPVCGRIKKRQGYELLCLWCGSTRTA